MTTETIFRTNCLYEIVIELNPLPMVKKITWAQPEWAVVHPTETLPDGKGKHSAISRANSWVWSCPTLVPLYQSIFFWWRFPCRNLQPGISNLEFPSSNLQPSVLKLLKCSPPGPSTDVIYVHLMAQWTPSHGAHMAVDEKLSVFALRPSIFSAR